MSLTGFVDTVFITIMEDANIPSAPAGRKLKFGCMDIALNTISIEPISMNQIFNEHGLMNLIS